MGVEKGQRDKFQYSSQQFRWAEPGSFARWAAKFALLAPGLYVLLAAVLFITPAFALPLVGLAVGLLSLLVVAAGFVCSLIALCNVGRLGREGLLGRGIAGLVLNGLFLTIIGVAVVHGFRQGRGQTVKARESQRDVS